MAENKQLHVVSNGHQTDAVIEGDRAGRSFHQTMLEWEYEPDEPNFTPRISAVSSLVPETLPYTEMSILRRSSAGNNCDRLFYRYEMFSPGFGYCIHTYMGDGNPLPAFQGEPYLLPLWGETIREIARGIWAVLNPSTRVSLAVKMIDIYFKFPKIFIINKFGRRVKAVKG